MRRVVWELANLLSFNLLRRMASKEAELDAKLGHGQGRNPRDFAEVLGRPPWKAVRHDP